jgi:anti-anti-sigma regulatory factor
MPLRITQKECESGRQAAHNGSNTEQCNGGNTVLKVQGTLYLEDAELLERICRDIGAQTGRHLTLDLADLSFLDTESASVLCRLKREQHVDLEGLHLFIAKVIELTEAEAFVREYLPKSE